MVAMHFWTAISPQDEDIQPNLCDEVEIAPKTEKSSELIVYQQNLFKVVDKP